MDPLQVFWAFWTKKNIFVKRVCSAQIKVVLQFSMATKFWDLKFSAALSSRLQTYTIWEPENSWKPSFWSKTYTSTTEFKKTSEYVNASGVITTGDIKRKQQLSALAPTHTSAEELSRNRHEISSSGKNPVFAQVFECAGKGGSRKREFWKGGPSWCLRCGGSSECKSFVIAIIGEWFRVQFP